MTGERALDSSLALLREGYTYLPRRLRGRGDDAFVTRLLGRRTTCLRGPDAARLFYDPTHFVRDGATPRRVRKTLTGDGGVQGLDGAEHHDRKAMFMQLMTPQRIDELVALFERAWRRAAPHWARSDRVVLFDQVQRLLCDSVCRWAGIPLPAGDVARRARDLCAMVDAFGAAGPRHWRGRVARRRSEAWIETIVGAVRDGRLEPGEQTALAVFAGHRDPRGRPLDRHVAAVELLNVLRPVVAIATYVTFEALALYRHPEWKSRIRTDADGTDTERFVHEVRRYYPFAPFVGARVRSDFDWHGITFRKGTLVLLDVYGAHHDDRLWRSAEEFDPDRFSGRDENAFDLIPQGGGDHATDHRCAGEWITIAVMASAARQLVTAVDYHVPDQDLGVDLMRIPTLPRSGFVIDRVSGTYASGETAPVESEGDAVSRSVRDETIRPEPELLGIYLNDHLAGATAGVQLIRRLARTMRESGMGEPLAGLADEIAQDRTALTEMMAELDVPVRRYKLYTAAATELAGRLKFNGHLLTRSPLSTVVELEMLRLGIEGKASGWRTLRAVAAQRGHPDPGRLDELIDRAVAQAALVETLRVRAVSLVLGVPAAT